MGLYGGPRGLVDGPRGGSRGETWGRAYHKTRFEYAESILATGLEPGGAHMGQMQTSEGVTPWPNRAYGLHPVFVFLDRASPDVIDWEPLPGQDRSDWLWLAVELAGLRVYPDIWLIRDLTQAG